MLIVGSGMIWIFADGGQIGLSEFDIETRAEFNFKGNYLEGQIGGTPDLGRSAAQNQQTSEVVGNMRISLYK